MSWWLNAWHESVARRELGALADRLGRAGLAVGGLAPGLVAAVDQHAAAVRDILTLGGGGVGAVELAGYARGVQDAARDTGWQQAATDSWGSDWVSLRLAAVCLLAAAGTVAIGDLLT